MKCRANHERQADSFYIKNISEQKVPADNTNIESSIDGTHMKTV